MRSQVTIRLPDGPLVALGHGDVIGRLWNAAVVLDDPRVSEAHALVSLRGPDLKLLALRGRFAVDGRVVDEVALREGQRIELTAGVCLEVVSVEVPDEVLGLEATGMALRALPGTCALVAGPPPGLAEPGHPAAVAHVWCQPEGWRVRPVGGAAGPIEDGDELELGGVVWRARRVSLARRAGATVPEPAFAGPLRVVARYETVHLHRTGAAPVVLAGLPARLVSELVAYGRPVPWADLCAELWGDGGSRKQLDMVLVRLRHKLRQHGVRADLVRADGAGELELFLRDGDVVEDRA